MSGLQAKTAPRCEYCQNTGGVVSIVRCRGVLSPLSPSWWPPHGRSQHHTFAVKRIHKNENYKTLVYVYACLSLNAIVHLELSFVIVMNPSTSKAAWNKLEDKISLRLPLHSKSMSCSAPPGGARMLPSYDVHYVRGWYWYKQTVNQVNKGMGIIILHMQDVKHGKCDRRRYSKNVKNAWCKVSHLRGY